MDELKPSSDAVKDWLLNPLSQEEATLVTQGKKHWAMCCLMQGLDGDPLREFDGLRVICRGPARDGLLDARGIVFLMFTGMPAIKFDTGNHSSKTSFPEGKSVLSGINQQLRTQPLHHRWTDALTGELRIFTERMITESILVPEPVQSALLATVHELQRDTAGQRPHVIWESWSTVFQNCCQQRALSGSIAFISYLLLWALFDAEELSNWRMWPDTAWLAQHHPRRERPPVTETGSSKHTENRQLQSEERNQLADFQKDDFVALCEKARMVEEHPQVSAFLFIQGSDLRACSRLPMYSEVKHRLHPYGTISGSKKFISHRWLDPSHPDPAGKQLLLLRERIDPAQYYWIDSCCFPQKPRTPEEETAFRKGISWLPSLFFGMDFLVLRCRDDGYLARAWCFFELYAATVLGRSISYIVEDSRDGRPEESADRLLAEALSRGSLLTGMTVTDSVDLPAIQDGMRVITTFFKLRFIEHYMGLGQRISDQQLFFGEDPYFLLSTCDISRAMAWTFQTLGRQRMQLVDFAQDYWDSNCFAKMAKNEAFRHTTDPYRFSHRIVRNDSVLGWLIINKNSTDSATNLFYILTSMIQ